MKQVLKKCIASVMAVFSFLVVQAQTTVTMISPASGVTCTNTFEYQVCQNVGAPGISHWIIGLPPCFTASQVAAVYINGTQYSSWTIGTDPSCNFFGLKVDNPNIAGGTCKTIKIVFNSFLSVGNANWASKASANCQSGSGAKGPSSCTPCQVLCQGSIGDRVWADADGDGIQDSGEPGISGVTVQLKNSAGAVIATTTTDINGNYVFNNLHTGNYTVVFPLSHNSGGLTTQNAGSNNSIDSDANTTTGATNVISLACDQVITNIDAGYRVCSGSIGDRVWADTDGDGIQDSGESGIGGVSVELRNAAGTLIATTTTNSNGNYTFSGLAPGSYTVVFPLVHNGGGLTTPNVGSDDNIDSDASSTTGITATINLTCSQNITNVDAGYRVCSGSIGDRVWADTDGDGIQDSGESGVSGVTIQLKNNGGNVIATTITDVNGNYSFSGLAPGNYTVVFPITYGGVTLTTPNAGSDDDADSDASTTTGSTANINLGCSQNVTNVDAGYRICSGSIGDRVWADTDGDGIQDAGEPGLSGVTVQLRNAAGNVIATTTTNVSGNYSFSGLPAGNYSVVFPLTHNSGGLTSQNIGSNDDVDSDASTTTGATGTIILGCSQNITNVDAGYLGCSGSIGDRVWADTDGDGIQDAGEPGISGVTVLLQNAAGTVIGTSVTNATGNYSFSGLPAGNYTVVFPLTHNSGGLSMQNVGSNDDVDSDASTTTGATGMIVLGCSQNITNVDAGYLACSGSIGDRVWLDTDGDGVQDSGEPGISGVTVQLKNAAGTVIATAITNTNGNYSFSGLAAGNYTVVFPTTNNSGAGLTTENAGGNDDLDSDANTGTGSTATITLGCSQNIINVDAGYQACLGSIGDRVWADADGDGIQDAGETGISGVTVQLRNSAAVVIATAITNINGNYTFSGLAAGNYSVVFPLTQGGQVLTISNVGSNDNVDSDASTTTGSTGTIILGCGQNITNIDAGYTCNGSIGDRVWMDTDADGLQDSNESGISGITVQLKNSAGVVIASTITNATGFYSFNGLSAGNYTVVFPLQHNHTMLTAPNVGSNDNIDSDVDPNTGSTAMIALACGQQITNVDAGYFECTGVIGDRVWLDADGDGIQDSGEPGLSGVTVQLLNAAGTVVATTTTNLTGNYVFFGLAAGTYSVTFPTTFNGSMLTIQNAGANEELDSDPNQSTGNTGPITLSTGQVITYVDAGYSLPAVMNPDFNVTYVNVQVNGSVRTNDVVPAGTTYGSPALTGSPAGSTQTITMNANGTYTFVANTPGVYTYNVPVCVPGAVAPCPTTVLTITVLNPTSTNNPPVANTDIAYTNVNTSVVIQTLANDRAGNPGGSLNPASVTVTVAAMHGTTSINPATGDNTYTPAPGFTGYDILTYRVCDNSTPTPLCATAQQVIFVKAAGLPNTTMAADDYAFTPMNVAVSGNVKTNDSDPEGHTQTVTSQTTTVAGKGTLVLNADGSYTFTPVIGVTGPVSFVYQTCDNGVPVACATATLYILVSPPSPVYNPDFNVTYVNVSVTGNVSTNDMVPAGTSYGSPALTGSPSGSVQTIMMNANGTYTFVANTPGVYTYNVPVCVPGAVSPCPNSLLTITVLAPTVTNNPPVANTDIAYTRINTPVTIRTLANDRAGNPGGSLNPASVTVTVAALHGTTSINPATGDNTYTPAPGYTGYDTLTYRVCDNSTPTPLCATARQIIFVQGNNVTNTTMAADDYAYTPINVSVSGNVKTNDSDPEGHTQLVTPQTTTVAGKGTLVLNADGTYTFTPFTGYTGPVSFVYQTCDNGVPSACANATLYILVSPQNLADFSPSNDIDALTFAPNQSRDFVVNINEVLNGSSSGQLVFRVRKISAFTITYNPTATTANFAGGTPVNNSDWIFTEDANFITVTLKPGVVIGPYSHSAIGFTITRNVGVPVNTTQNITTTIVTGTGGDTNSANNQAVTSITAN